MQFFLKSNKAYTFSKFYPLLLVLKHRADRPNFLVLKTSFFVLFSTFKKFIWYRYHRVLFRGIINPNYVLFSKLHEKIRDCEICIFIVIMQSEPKSLGQNFLIIQFSYSPNIKNKLSRFAHEEHVNKDKKRAPRSQNQFSTFRNLSELNRIQ